MENAKVDPMKLQRQYSHDLHRFGKFVLPLQSIEEPILRRVMVKKDLKICKIDRQQKMVK